MSSLVLCFELMVLANQSYRPVFTIRNTDSFLSEGTTLEPGVTVLIGTPQRVRFAGKLPNTGKMVMGCTFALFNDVKEESTTERSCVISCATDRPTFKCGNISRISHAA